MCDGAARSWREEKRGMVGREGIEPPANGV